MTESFPAKDVSETKKVLTFNATAELAPGETLTSIKSTEVSVVSGPPDTNAAALVSGAIVTAADVSIGGKTIAAGRVAQAVAAAGVSGCIYLVKITCNTSNPNNVLTLKGLLPVTSD